jgi:hypothetical protein
MMQVVNAIKSTGHNMTKELHRSMMLASLTFANGKLGDDTDFAAVQQRGQNMINALNRIQF